VSSSGKSRVFTGLRAQAQAIGRMYARQQPGHRAHAGRDPNTSESFLVSGLVVGVASCAVRSISSNR
jgi:hypothetical protein